MKNLINKLKLISVKLFEHAYYWLGVPDEKHDRKYQEKYIDPLIDKNKSGNKRKQ